MPRIQPIDEVPDEDLAPARAPLNPTPPRASTFRGGPTSMSTLFRVMAHRPELMQHCRQLLETVMHSGTVDARLKELLAVRVSQVNHCSY